MDGFSPVVDAPLLGGYVVRVRFKQWATLTGCCHLPLSTVGSVEREEWWLNNLSLMATKVPRLGSFIGRPGLASRAVRRIKRAYIKTGERADTGLPPDYFLLETYNPSGYSVKLSLVASGNNELSKKMPFQRLLDIAPGFNRITIPFQEISPMLGKTDKIDVGLNPNILKSQDEGLTLFFGLICFVRDPSYRQLEATSNTQTAKAKKVKVVIWDLDNTVWDGTLIEDGPERIRLKPSIVEIIRELDHRGIVNSVASKNDEAYALAQLERFGLREYFVFPMIGWGPKSEAIKQIKDAFNVGEDTLAFIDDQVFEREEVRARNPLVRVYSHEQCEGLLANEEFDVPQTPEARNRRAFYQSEEVRRQAIAQYSGGYLEFLQKCNIKINITVPTEENYERIHEIVQRTNQMNFSGTKYSKQDLLGVLRNPDRECFLIDADDNYGNYGYIGFCVVHPRPIPRVLDLMFSCRIQSKRVEHACLIFLMERYAAQGAARLEVRYHETDRNKPLAQVFSDLCFEIESRNNRDFNFEYDLTKKLPENSIVTVRFSGHSDGIVGDHAAQLV
jgi:FkbH-like protein